VPATEITYATKPTLIYLHGGGWTLFSLDTHDRLMREVIVQLLDQRRSASTRLGATSLRDSLNG